MKKTVVKETVSFRIESDLVDRMTKEAARERRTVSDWIRLTVEAALGATKKQHGH